MGSFFPKGDDGTIGFNHDEALKFTLPQDGKQRFTYQADRRKVVEAKEPDKPKTPEEVRQGRIDEEKKYRKDVQDQQFFGLNKLLEIIPQELYTTELQEAVRAAAQEVQKKVNADFEDRDMKNRFEMEDRLKKEFGSEKEHADFVKEANSNISAVINDMASQLGITDSNEQFKKYAELMEFGKPIIDQLFDMMHPEFLKDHTMKEIRAGMDKWWNTEIASNKQTLNFLMARIYDSLNTSLSPYMIEQTVAGRNSLEKQNKRGSGRSPSNISRSTPKPSKGASDVLNYFGRGAVDDLT